MFPAPQMTATPATPGQVTNRNAADLLFDVATILELAEDNPYRVRAYRRAARLLLRQQDEARAHIDEKGELSLPGLGPRLRKKLGELISTGRMGFYLELCAELPDAISELMRIPTVGPKTAWRLHAELGLSTAAGVKRAAEAGWIRTLFGFGERREVQLKHGAEEVLAGRPKVYAPVPLDIFERDEPAELPERGGAPVMAQLELPEAA